MLLVSDDPIDVSAELAHLQAQNISAGAIVSFSGHVRETSVTGNVEALLLQSYSPLTENGIAAAIEDARTRWELIDLKVLHRTGRIETGETIVFVAVASAHRRDAFEACDFLMDYLKTKAVFWKKEITLSGEYWIEPRAQDHQDATRWEKKKEVSHARDQ